MNGVRPLIPHERLSNHAMTRSAQRRIEPLILDLLLDFGAEEKSNRGASVKFFDKKARRRLRRAIGKKTYDRLSDLLDAYLIIADGMIVTVGHRYRPIQHH